MINYRKKSDIRFAMTNLVGISSEELIATLFEDNPNLVSIEFSKSNEYDDSNYYDSCELTAINGYSWDVCEETYAYDDSEDGEDRESLEDKIVDVEVIAACREMVDLVGKDFGYGEHTLSRNDYAAKRKRTQEEKTIAKYICSFLNKEKIDDEKVFLKAEPKWALYYAHDFGPFKDKDVEHKVFTKKGRMEYAYFYAVHVLKGKLPENIENFYILDSFNKTKEDKDWLVKYLEFKKGVENAG